MSSVYIIAEIGNSHEGSLGLAKKFAESAARCGVDCIKFQTHMFEAESLPNAPNPPYFKDETRQEYFDRTAFNTKQWAELKRFIEEDLGLDFMSSPFSLEAVDLLESIGVESFKIASGEVTNLPLLEKVARTGKKVYLSSGMSNWAELDQAVDTLRQSGCKDLLVFQCTSEYPCPPEQAGLNAMVEMKNRYQCEVGYSDHTLGLAVPLSAVVMGASVIEKHFVLSKDMYGSDAKNATEPAEFGRLVSEIRAMEQALSHTVDKDKKAAGLQSMKWTFEKSIVAARDLSKGTEIIMDDLAFKKPGNGINANQFKLVLGKTLKTDLSKNEQLSFEILEK
ncbi:N-acetylneuraminate synthase family protein [Roseivirga pacifica]|uniref:N-acetylneuraminate synthase family protein n=1 Tax=Roseivirga pacifica TaxID=1267423 RepID=UPI00227AB7BF|nr:N-acetylneuraminate synthase family protein [Roseivirga pacifica]